MQITHDLKLLKLIKIIPPVIVTAFAFLVMIIVINHNNNQMASDIASLQKDFIESEKELIKAQVQQVVQQASYERDNTEATLKKDIKERIYQAHAIATAIYKQNQDKSEARVTQLITNALRNVRFNQGRGYYFIYKTNGLNVMHPVVPAMEGTSKIDFQDVRGNYIVRDMGALAKKDGEGFYHWWFVKPQNKTNEFEKIGFGKHFAPYDWFIGTGEYVIDVENDLKTRLIRRISNIRYGVNGYIFVTDYQGNVLSHFRKEYEGTNLYKNNDENVTLAGSKIIELAKKGEGYLSYLSPVMPSTGKPAEKISYISGFPQWNWAIGSGSYMSEIENYLSNRKALMEQQNQGQLLNILWLSLFVTLFFITLSLILSKYLARRFTLFRQKMDADFAELNLVKIESQYQALHDSLTKLPNRTLLEDQISQGITLSKENNNSLAVMFVDLDDFKKINDLYGHSIGDSLLKTLGDKFNQLLDDGDSVARFGGDEFIFCFPQLESVNQAEDKVESILEIFNNEFNIQGKSVYSSCSIGIAMYPTDADKAEELISKADIVLYKSKLDKKGHFLFFNESINKQVKRDYLLESELRLALVENELDVHYQPQISVESGEILSVEALVRWNNKILGPISPVEFIQIAEDIGIINEIGSFVINKSIRDIMMFNHHNTQQLQLSINISPKQLMEPQFIADVVKVTDEVGFARKNITLEITENVLISDIGKVRPILQTLRDYEFRLSLDDFGTGFSSLSYLSNLPITEIKIDRSFIDKFLTNHQSESLVKTIIAIGQFCDLTVVAEGVETKAQYERLVLYRCDLIQGYYFDKPMSLAELITKHQHETLEEYIDK